MDFDEKNRLSLHHIASNKTTNKGEISMVRVCDSS